MKSPIKLLLAILLLTGLVLTPVSKVLAIDEVFYSGNDILFFNPNLACSTDGGGITNASDVNVDGGASTKEHIKAILTYFTSKGLTLAAAAGIAGNVQSESGFYPARIQGSGIRLAPAAKKDVNGEIITSTIFKPVNEQGFGLSQWSFSDRQMPLYNAAVRKKVDIIDINLQLDYMWAELSTGYKQSTLDKIKNMTDAGEAGKVYMLNFERPEVQSAAAQEGRAKQAEAIFNTYKSQITDVSGSTVTTTATSTSSGTVCQTADETAGAVGVANGFTFPLKTTQAAVKKGTGGMVWCITCTTSPHHDYPAADIHVETGTPILAAKSGTVVGKTTDSCDYYGCNVSIMGDDNILYYYTHMSKQASVNKSQHVQAGQQIGTVGTDATAMNTPRHLHFDMMPGDKYKTRPSCSGSACTQYDFIDVQKFLVPAFNALPAGGSVDV